MLGIFGCRIVIIVRLLRDRLIMRDVHTVLGLVASINRNFRGLGRELFTDTGESKSSGEATRNLE